MKYLSFLEGSIISYFPSSSAFPDILIFSACVNKCLLHSHHLLQFIYPTFASTNFLMHLYFTCNRFRHSQSFPSSVAVSQSSRSYRVIWRIFGRMELCISYCCYKYQIKSVLMCSQTLKTGISYQFDISPFVFENDPLKILSNLYFSKFFVLFIERVQCPRTIISTGFSTLTK